MRRALLLLLLACAAAQADTLVNDTLIKQKFELQAIVVNGCLLGSGSSDATTFGDISFGQISTLPTDRQVTSVLGAGSIVLQCTPGTPVAIALNSGIYTASVSGGRFLGLGSGRLRYQLYKDPGNSTVWGDNSNGATAMSITFPGSGGVQSYPVYARLFSTASMPAAGIYSDTVTVTITY